MIGARGSPLALIQANWVLDQLRKKYPTLEVSIKKIKTSGDVRTDHPLSGQGRKGLYTREIENELAAGTINCAVHSMKDVPTELESGFSIGAITERKDPRDVFISEKYEELLDVPKNAKIGTSSLRRMTQLKNLRPDLEVLPLRGNIETRLRKMRTQGLDGILLAAAGVERLGMTKVIREYLKPTVLMPAAGQGALGIEVRSDDEETLRRVNFLNDRDSALTIRAERACVRRLSGGCEVPITAYAEVDGPHIEMMGLVATPDGREILRDQVQGPLKEPEQTGLRLAEALLSQGAQRMIDQIQAHVR